jgi:predicted nuclease of restriction endonuclease-like (RecB) superfamily
MADIEKSKPEFVTRDGIIADTDYIQWLADVKKRFRESQARAIVKVNSEMLEFYWSIGRDLVALRAESRWGAGVVKQFALDMRETFPDSTGFSYSNVKYMKQWYSFYYERITKSQQPVGQIEEDEKSQQPAGLLEMPSVFGQVPWGHHIHIFSMSNSLDEALFYVNKVAKEGWSRSMLENQLETHLFQREGAIPSNFDTTLPAEQSQGAQQIFKDPYHFEFLSLQENYTEHELEEALVQNITHFLLELGKGFAYVGRQMELRMEDGTAFFPDLVFYHIPQKRYVVIELKAVEFMPEFAGKLNFYVTAADELLRGEGDNPSVGIIICKTAKKTVVEWSLKDIQKPLGVATYQIEQIVERTVLELKQREKKK